MPASYHDLLWPVTSVAPTGLRRHRRQKWTGRMVLQIEMKGTTAHHITGRVGKTKQWWRDATYADLIPVEG